MTKYLVMLFFITCVAGYMFYDLRRPAEPISAKIDEIKKDKTPIESWPDRINSRYVDKLFTDRLTPEVKEPTEQKETPPPLPVRNLEKRAEVDIPLPQEEAPVEETPPQEEAPVEETPPEEQAEPLPPGLNEGQRQNWEALQRGNQEEQNSEPPVEEGQENQVPPDEQQGQAEPEPQLDGGQAEAPPPPVQYGQYPCSVPDCPGNPDVQDFLAKRHQYEGGGWSGQVIPGRGIEIRAPSSSYISTHGDIREESKEHKEGTRENTGKDTDR